MKLHDIMEEMGASGMDKIRKNLINLVRRLKLKGSYSANQGESGTTIVIVKDNKPFARVPISKAMDANFLTSVLTKKEM
jgi:hypothetical protein